MSSLTDKQKALLQQLSEVVMQIPFNQLLGLRVDEIHSDQVLMHFSMKKELIGNFMHQILHGGVISSVLDMVGGVAVMAAAVSKHQHQSIEEIAAILSKSSTIDLQISFLRPGKGTQFIAKAYATHSGNKISFARMDLYNQDEALIATGSATYHIA